MSKNKYIFTDKRSWGGCNGMVLDLCAGGMKFVSWPEHPIEVFSFILSIPPTKFKETASTTDLFGTLPHSSFPSLTVDSVYAVCCKRNHEKKNWFLTVLFLQGTNSRDCRTVVFNINIHQNSQYHLWTCTFVSNRRHSTSPTFKPDNQSIRFC